MAKYSKEKLYKPYDQERDHFEVLVEILLDLCTNILTN